MTVLLPEIDDPFELPLVRVGGRTKPFTIDLPEDWVHEDLGGVDQFKLLVDGYTGAFITVECGEPRTRDELLEYTSYNLALQEQRILGDGNPQLGSASEITQIEVHGRTGAMYSAERRLGVTAGALGVSVFFAEPDCAWSISMLLGGVGDIGQYRSLFGRIVSTFQPGER